MAEALANEIVDAQNDVVDVDGNQGIGQSRARARDWRRRHRSGNPKPHCGSYFLKNPLVCCSRVGRGFGDGDLRCAYEESRVCDPDDGHRSHENSSGVEELRDAGCNGD